MLIAILIAAALVLLLVLLSTLVASNNREPIEVAAWASTTKWVFVVLIVAAVALEIAPVLAGR